MAWSGFPRFLRHTISLTARLTMLFAAGASAVLLALGFLINVSIERHFEDLDRDTLRAGLIQAHHAIARVTTVAELQQLPAILSDPAHGHHGLLMHLVGPQGQVLASPALPVFTEPFGQTVQLTDPAPPLQRWSIGERNFRGLATRVASAIPDAAPLEVRVAIDIGHHQVFMDTLMGTLWLFVACAAVAAGLLGWFAAKRGLAPLRAMRSRAERVTAQSLDQRLPTDAVPAELADLAHTLNEMLARLEEAFRRLSDFSSDIAHELRTPVSNLMTQTQVSLARNRDATGYREILESNAEEFERLARMISDMLFLAKADNAHAATRALVQPEPVDLAREVGDLFEFYEALADERGIQLQCTGQANTRGDRLMLRRALSNLLSNALRYTPPGGCVQVRLTTQGEFVQVAVVNPGDSIAPEHLVHLFERFYRADPSRQNATGEGTGLGLAITQAIVLAHQGRITATSADGLTCFTLLLPRA
ncbi:MAG: heavy metal sensor histidine kinase [Burkholderiales bacterium]|nr:heavy metal sensor histidine kinase [Burkholderiales bacterium]